MNVLIFLFAFCLLQIRKPDFGSVEAQKVKI
ncbi:MAG: hypothetical protein JWP12_795 [Bacteroidetes bacterium]|nr:hypothetical protein [Bacteroidota bacterium]